MPGFFVKLFKAGKSIAPWATIVAAAVAVFTFCYGYRQFRQTQEATRTTLAIQRTTLAIQKESLESEREARAVELFVKYNETMFVPPAGTKARKSPDDFWRNNLAISISESIFKLRRDDGGWRETVRWMISKQAENLKHTGLDCGTFDAEFITLVNDVVKKNVCNAQ